MNINERDSFNIAARAAAGEDYGKIADDYGVARHVISHHARKHGIRRMRPFKRRCFRKPEPAAKKTAPRTPLSKRMLAIVEADEATLALIGKVPGTKVTDITPA